MVNSRDHGNAVGRDGQLRGRLRVGRPPALQREQADGHLQVVHQPMIGFLAQEFSPLDQLVLLTKQRFTLRQRVAQADLQSFLLEQLAFAALDGAARRARKGQGGRHPTAAHLVAAAHPLWIFGPVAHKVG